MLGSRTLVLFVCLAAGVRAADDSATTLARILAGKGVISNSELAAIESAAATQDRVAMLAKILEDKGVLSKDEAARLAPMPAVTVARAAAPVDGAQAARPKETPPPPAVAAQSKFPVSVYGTLLTNAFFNTSANNIEDIPLFASKQGSDPLGNDKNFGMTARESRFGLRYQGGRVGGAQLSGQLELDLLGGKASFGNGINMDLVRLRLALGRLDWENVALEFGQDWSIFAPLNPISLAEFAIPGLSASGNPWIRMPQFRAEFKHKYGDNGRAQLQVAAVDPNMGDYPGTFSSGRAPSVGERGRAPGLEARLALTQHAYDRDFTVGFSTHYARGKNAGALAGQNVQVGLNSWGVALDATLPVTGKFNISGEAYDGRALGIFSVAAGEAVLPVGTPGERGVLSRGGWIQGQLNVTPKWQLNLAYGLDAPQDSDLRTGDRSKNQTYMGNVMYKFSPHVTFAWEWRRFLTDFLNQRAANERGDHANMAVAYTF